MLWSLHIQSVVNVEPWNPPMVKRSAELFGMSAQQRTYVTIYESIVADACRSKICIQIYILVCAYVCKCDCAGSIAIARFQVWKEDF